MPENGNKAVPGFGSMANRLAARLGVSRGLLRTIAAIATVVGSVALGVVDAPRGSAQPQSAVHPEFDVASVKVFKPGSAPGFPGFGISGFSRQTGLVL